ncbi:MAG: hypothetical protein OXI87_11430 [Albidovulum sp.]|nr:hypothetical protein [Albidovulum sp.]
MDAKPLWRGLWWALAAGLCLRAAISLWGDFTIHPDEVFQYLEPAHGLVFGNSVEYWEFYYGGRSWLVPGIVASVLWICGAFGLDEPVYYIAAVKLFFCLISLAIPFSMYSIGRRLFGELSGRLSLVLGTFWFELVGYAHKPMTEFLATPLLLFLIVLTIGSMSPKRAALLGAVAALVVAVRFQYAVPAAVLGVMALLRGTARERLLVIVVGLATIAAVGLFELLTWGEWFHSYWLNFNLNLIWNEFREDESSWYQYLAWLSLASGGAILVAAAASAWNLQRRWLLLAMAILIVLPHMLQPHKEYRFIFAAIPIWLILFADILATGLSGRAKDTVTGISKNYWSKTGLGWAAAVSILGLLNAIPYQRHLSVAYSNEIGKINYLREQDPIFEAYRMLSGDPNFRGLLDITRGYFNTGGYYYLHRHVPFYQSTALRQIEGISAENLRNYVSHIVATSASEIGRIGRLRDDESTAVLEIDGKFRILPAIVHRGETGRLVYVGREGGSEVLEGWELTADWGEVTLWSSDDRESPVRRWKEYKIFPDNEGRQDTMKQILGERTPPPVPLYGIRFAD